MTNTPPPVKAPPRKVLYVAGAAAGAFVVYAYWHRASSPPAPTTADTSLPDPTMPTVTTTTVPDNTDVIATNAEWTQHAADILSQTGGWSAQFVYTALGHYLARRQLTSQEQDAVLAAIAAVGAPPSGGPYPILSAPGGPPITPPAFRYVVEPHHIGNTPRSVRALIQQWSDPAVTTATRLTSATAATIADPRNTRWATWSALHNGYYPANIIAQFHVVKRG